MRQMPNVAARFARLRLAPLKLDLLRIRYYPKILDRRNWQVMSF